MGNNEKKVKMDLRQIQKYETYMLEVISKLCDDADIVYYLNCGSVLGAVRHHGPIPWDSDVDIIIPVNQLDYFCKVCKEKLPSDLYIHHYTTSSDSYILFPRIGIRGYKTDRLHIDCFPLVGLPNDSQQQRRYSKVSDLLKKIYYVKKLPVDNLLLYKKFILLTAKLFLFPLPSKKIIKLFRQHCEYYPYQTSDFVMNPCGHYGVKNILPKSTFGDGKMIAYQNLNLRVPTDFDEYLTHYYGDYMKIPKTAEIDINRMYDKEKENNAL